MGHRPGVDKARLSLQAVRVEELSEKMSFIGLCVMIVIIIVVGALAMSWVIRQ